MAHCKEAKNINNAAVYLLDDASRSAMIACFAYVMTSALLLFLLAIS